MILSGYNYSSSLPYHTLVGFSAIGPQILFHYKAVIVSEAQGEMLMRLENDELLRLEGDYDRILFE